MRLYYISCAPFIHAPAYSSAHSDSKLCYIFSFSSVNISLCMSLMQSTLTLALAGGSMRPPPPEDFFLRCTPNYEADCAEVLHSLWGIFCATFGKKKTGSCQVTDL